jgi:hypothetical protein
MATSFGGLTGRSLPIPPTLQPRGRPSLARCRMSMGFRQGRRHSPGRVADRGWIGPAWLVRRRGDVRRRRSPGPQLPASNRHPSSACSIVAGRNCSSTSSALESNFSCFFARRVAAAAPGAGEPDSSAASADKLRRRAPARPTAE